MAETLLPGRFRPTIETNFRIANRLQCAGMAIEDIRDMLNQHHGDSFSDRAARKAQVRVIIAHLEKRGAISGIHGNARQ